MKFYFILFFFILTKSYAASCCGGGSSFPGLITGDYKAQVGFSVSQQNELGKAYDEGNYVYYEKNKKRIRQNYSLYMSSMISERAQIGAKATFIHTDYKNPSLSESESIIGDSEVSFGYEFLQERSFSWWRPRGFIFTATTIPTGKSNYDSKTSLYSDVSGKDQWAQSLGLSFIKIIRTWDLLSLMQVGNRFAANKGDTKISDSQFFSTLIGAGISPFNSAFRLGINLSYFQESSKEVHFGSKLIRTQKEYYYEMTSSLSYAYDPDFSITLNYSDQSILGPAQNTTISRSVGMLFHKRWSL